MKMNTTNSRRKKTTWPGGFSTAYIKSICEVDYAPLN